MRKLFFIFFGLFLLLSVSCNTQKAKTVEEKSDFKKMGGIKWYTEKNFEKALEKAKKENRKLFVVFSALWCSPCQQLKHNVFKNEKFKDILGDILPVYIEQTTKKGNELCKKYKIRAFPTIKILNSEGKEIASTTGARIEMSYYANWLKLAKKGITYDNIFNLIKQKKISFKDAVDFADSLSYRDYDKSISVLKEAIANLKCEDSKTGYKAVSLLIDRIGSKSFLEKKSNDKKFYNSYKKIIAKYVNCLSPNYKNMAWFLWECMQLNIKPQLNKATILIKDFKVKDFLGNYPIEFGFTIGTFILNKQKNTVTSLLDKAKEIVKDEPNENEKKKYLYNFARSVFVALGAFRSDEEAKNYKNELEQMVGYVWDLYDFYKDNSIVEDGYLERLLIIFAKYHGLGVNKTLAFVKENVKEALSKEKLTDNEAKKINSIIRSGVDISLNNYGAKKTLVFVKELIENGDKLLKLKKTIAANILNSICWSFVEKNYSDSYLISLSEKSLKLDRQPEILDTLANLYAIKGNYKEALELEKEALKMLEDKKASDKQKEPYKKFIEKIQKKLK